MVLAEGRRVVLADAETGVAPTFSSRHAMGLSRRLALAVADRLDVPRDEWPLVTVRGTTFQCHLLGSVWGEILATHVRRRTDGPRIPADALVLPLSRHEHAAAIWPFEPSAAAEALADSAPHVARYLALGPYHELLPTQEQEAT